MTIPSLHVAAMHRGDAATNLSVGRLGGFVGLADLENGEERHVHVSDRSIVRLNGMDGIVFIVESSMQ